MLENNCILKISASCCLGSTGVVNNLLILITRVQVPSHSQKGTLMS